MEKSGFNGILLVFVAVLTLLMLWLPSIHFNHNSLFENLISNVANSGGSGNNFNVKLTRAPAKVGKSAPVELISPRPNSALQTGRIRFEWSFKSKIQKKSILVVEKIGDDKADTYSAGGGKSFALTLSPGRYRWQIKFGVTPVSVWRYLDVVDNRERGMASRAGPTQAIKGGADDAELTAIELRKATVEHEAVKAELDARAAKVEAEQALKREKEQEQKLADLKKEKQKFEKLYNEQLAVQKAAKEAEKRRLALREKEIRKAQQKVIDAKDHYEALLKQTQVAKNQLEQAEKYLAVQSEVPREAQKEARTPATKAAAESENATSPSERDVDVSPEAAESNSAKAVSIGPVTPTTSAPNSPTSLGSANAGSKDKLKRSDEH